VSTNKNQSPVTWNQTSSIIMNDDDFEIRNNWENINMWTQNTMHEENGSLHPVIVPEISPFNKCHHHCSTAGKKWISRLTCVDSKKKNTPMGNFFLLFIWRAHCFACTRNWFLHFCSDFFVSPLKTNESTSRVLSPQWSVARK